MMSEADNNISRNNKRIAKNTLYMYARKIFTILLAFYTSRLLLQRLGIDDFGLYGLIGSIVVMFNAIRSFFSNSIQRYINIAIGKEDNIMVRKVFSIGMFIHVLLAIGFVICCEIAGIIILPDLNIPQGSYVAAQWVLQFSIFTAAVTLLTVPYDAILIAYEKLNVFAWISIIDYILRLLIVILLILFNDNRVIYYSAMLLGVTIIIRGINSVYCRYKFGKLVKIEYKIDKPLAKEMTVLAGWNFFGNLGYALVNAGSNFILNIFGGVAINAARSVANQVIGNIQQFVSDLNTSFNPRYIIYYGRKEYSNASNLMYLSSRFAFLICSTLGVPIACFAPYVLKLWLTEVPEYSAVFIQTILLYIIIRSLHSPINTLFLAAGKMKHYQLTEFVIFIMNLPLSYLALKIGLPYYSVFVIMAALEVINLVAILYVAKIDTDFDLKDYVVKVLLRITPFIILMGITFCIVEWYIKIPYSILNTILAVLICMIYTVIIGFFTMFTLDEIMKMKKMVLRK